MNRRPLLVIALGACLLGAVGCVPMPVRSFRSERRLLKVQEAESRRHTAGVPLFLGTAAIAGGVVAVNAGPFGVGLLAGAPWGRALMLPGLGSLPAVSGRPSRRRARAARSAQVERARRVARAHLRTRARRQAMEREAQAGARVVGELPKPRIACRVSSRLAELVVVNATPRSLFVATRGRLQAQVVVAPGARGTLHLPPGSYWVYARARGEALARRVVIPAAGWRWETRVGERAVKSAGR